MLRKDGPENMALTGKIYRVRGVEEENGLFGWLV